MSSRSQQSIDVIKQYCQQYLHDIVTVDSYQYASCYLWYDRPLYDSFGDVIRHLKGNTIYLFEDSESPLNDLFHELGHLIARRNNLVGHMENSFHGYWEEENSKLIALVSDQRHWSSYLNQYAKKHEDFVTNAASEIWAELFMLWHLNPNCPEAMLIDQQMRKLATDKHCCAISTLLTAIKLIYNPNSDDQRQNNAENNYRPGIAD